MSYPTTRKYPRTMAQAFPQDHAEAVTVYRRPRYLRLLNVALAVLIGVILGATLFFELGAA